MNLTTQFRTLNRAIEETKSVAQKNKLREIKQILMSWSLIFGSRKKFKKELQAFLLTREFSHSLTKDIIEFLDQRGLLIK